MRIDSLLTLSIWLAGSREEEVVTNSEVALPPPLDAQRAYWMAWLFRDAQHLDLGLQAKLSHGAVRT